ncbi:hypothetical protein [Microbacterium sp. gxy059]|uniref:hypothetical protein n=1 Tax=Microbacterium sp. gxy059 TaxID=2957199 RepID=UPI003D99D91C
MTGAGLAMGAALAASALTPAAAASSPPAGPYAGETSAGDAVEFVIDERGALTEFSTVSTCTVYSMIPSTLVVIWPGANPPIDVRAGEPFAAEWVVETDTASASSEYELSGVVNADGTASGTGVVSMDLPVLPCVGSEFEWTASLDGEAPDPDPVYEPTATVSPAELTESELADSGVTISGEGFAPDSEVSLSVSGDEVGSQSADADGAVSFAFASDALGAGEHEAVLTAEEGEASVVFSVTEDAPAPGTIPGEPPSEDDLDPALDGAIAVPASAEPGDEISIAVTGAEPLDEVGVWLFSDPVSLGTQTVGADGRTTATIPADTEPGEHEVAVWASDETLIGWDRIEIVAADDGEEGEGPGEAADDAGESGEAADDAGEAADDAGEGSDETGEDSGEGTEGAGDAAESGESSDAGGEEQGEAGDGSQEDAGGSGHDAREDGADLAPTGGSPAAPLGFAALLMLGGAAAWLGARRRTA